MKITIGINGTAPAVSDYGMLKAALLAAQAATPTSRANGAPETQATPHAALHAIFSNNTGIEALSVDIGHSFNIDAPRQEDRA